MDIDLKKAEILFKNFGLYGQGNFDLSTEEVALILQLVESEDERSLNLLYEKLSKERLG